MATSNYPPGVSGAEPQIIKYDDEDGPERVCGSCGDAIELGLEVYDNEHECWVCPGCAPY